jgi:DNA polymerase III subunit alpha
MLVPKSFVHLHLHTEFSVLDGMGRIHEYIERAVELQQPALAVTDHGNICAAPEFYKECRKAGIEPIIGEEFYYYPDHNAKPDQKQQCHVTVLARGFEGYKVLAELSTAAHGQYHYKPLLDDALLDGLGDAARHLTVLSGCAGSSLSKKLIEEDEDGARAELIKWREWFPNYYLELMHHDTDFDKRLNEALVELGQRYSVPWVITNDPHYADPDDAAHHDALLAIQTGSDIDAEDRFRFDGSGYHLRSRSEMFRTFRQYGEDVWKPGIRTTLQVAKDCHIRIPSWESRTWQIPKFPDTDDAYGDLKRLVNAELRRRGFADKPEYVAQAKSELKVIKKVGIEHFLLITMDLIQEARRRGIPVGPGRGSVCGSLVNYLIGIHKIDPIKYKLRFDRFLNPARPRMPDIDSDFGQRRRTEMFDYAEEKYGRDNVMHVAAFQNMKTKRAFQSLAKAYGVSFTDRNRISKEIVDDEESGEAILPDEITEQFPELAAQLDRLSGLKSSLASHPAGVLIADPSVEIRKQVPEMWLAGPKKWVGQFDLEAVEAMGLMKEDLLGLRTLDTIDECLKMLRARGIDLDPDSWSPDDEVDDKKVYRMLAKGDTSGVFQMEGPVNQRGCRDVKPKSFEDLVSITSLYRTGPIKAGFPKQFIDNRKAGTIEYIHPSLEPILGDTWGVILYQEQVMEIGEKCAGFDMVQVDDIKEAIKHKKSALMESMRPLFIAGTRRTVGMSKAASTQIWKQIEGYSGYSYNRSHAVAYTFLTYQTARLKHLYPLEFYAALLRTTENKKDNRPKRDTYLRGAISRGATIAAPHINFSDDRALAHYDTGTIRLGFEDLSGVGPAAAQKLVGGRPDGGYTDREQVAEAVRNKGTMKVVLQGVDMSELGVRHDIAASERLLGFTLRDTMAPYRRKYRNEVLLPQDAGPDGEVVLVGEIYEIRHGKTKNDKPYVTWKLRWSLTDSFDVRLWSETERYWDLKKGSVVMIEGEWESRWLNVSCGNPRKIKVIKAVRTED